MLECQRDKFYGIYELLRIILIFKLKCCDICKSATWEIKYENEKRKIIEVGMHKRSD